MKQARKEVLSLIVLALVSIGTSALLFECKKSSDNNTPGSSGSPGANEVWIQNMNFNPAALTVAVNTTVTWMNKDGTAHTVTSTTGAFESGNIGSGGNYTRQFTVKGKFPYKCSIHSSMTGTVVVQ